MLSDVNSWSILPQGLLGLSPCSAGTLLCVTRSSPPHQQCRTPTCSSMNSSSSLFVSDLGVVAVKTLGAHVLPGGCLWRARQKTFQWRAEEAGLQVTIPVLQLKHTQAAAIASCLQRPDRGLCMQVSRHWLAHEPCGQQARQQQPKQHQHQVPAQCNSTTNEYIAPVSHANKHNTPKQHSQTPETTAPTTQIAITVTTTS